MGHAGTQKLNEINIKQIDSFMTHLCFSHAWDTAGPCGNSFCPMPIMELSLRNMFDIDLFLPQCLLRKPYQQLLGAHSDRPVMLWEILKLYIVIFPTSLIYIHVKNIIKLSWNIIYSCQKNKRTCPGHTSIDWPSPIFATIFHIKSSCAFTGCNDEDGQWSGWVHQRYIMYNIYIYSQSHTGT